MKDKYIIPRPILTRCAATTSSIESNNLKELNLIQQFYQKIYLFWYEFFVKCLNFFKIIYKSK